MLAVTDFFDKELGESPTPGVIEAVPLGLSCFIFKRASAKVKSKFSLAIVDSQMYWKIKKKRKNFYTWNSVTSANFLRIIFLNLNSRIQSWQILRKIPKKNKPH